MRTFLFCVLAALAGATHAATTYTVSDAHQPFGYVSLNVLPLANDELSPPISPPGFSFSYFGQSYNAFRVGTNGYMMLCQSGAGGAGSVSKTPDHAGAPGCYLSPLWLDLIVASNAVIGWSFSGGELVVEWSYVNQFFGAAYQPIPAPAVNMRVRLKTSGEIEFCYGDQSPLAVPHFKTDAHTVAISGPSGVSQTIIDGALSGYVSAGVMTAWPTDRVIRFTPYTPPNNAPAISVNSAQGGVSSGGTLHVAHNSDLAALALNIAVTDADSDTVTLAGSVSNIMLTGIANAEFSSPAVQAPYTLVPASGRFVHAGVTHLVTLAADDGNGGSTQFTFSIVVAAANSDHNGLGLVPRGGSGGCAAGGTRVAGLLCTLPLLLLGRRRLRSLD